MIGNTLLVYENTDQGLRITDCKMERVEMIDNPKCLNKQVIPYSELREKKMIKKSSPP